MYVIIHCREKEEIASWNRKDMITPNSHAVDQTQLVDPTELDIF